MLSVGKRSSDEFAGGNLEQLFIKSTYGYIVMMLLNKELILTVITKPNDMLEQLFIDIKSSAQHLIV
jgi:predicted regulator of Ras-like GTPase activity (Roadblock/LC7/MglB family)